MAGKHKIHVQTEDYEKIFSLVVSKRFDENCVQTKFRILDSPFNCKLNNKINSAYIVSLDGRAENVLIKNNTSLNYGYQNTENSNNLKLFRCNSNNNLKDFVSTELSYKNISRNVINQNEKKFFIVNTENQMMEPHAILFRKYYSSASLDVWVPKDTLIDVVAVDACIAEAESIVVLRVTEIFGKPADIDENNKITIVFSKTINDEGKALGFFNPADFFKNNNDKSSSLYNPTSNEADVIYAALPSSNLASNYYYKAIAATVGHELTHAVTFTEKTYSRIKNGNVNAPRMKIFLDEGISHLAENLIGFGISGGNIKFFKKFITNTEYYSFSENNIFGLEDSAGQRGAMTLFLSWCFWEKGGISWKPGNTAHVIDKGGISFIKKLINSEYIGWEAIGNAFGVNTTDELFLQMLDCIAKISESGELYSYKIDPLTNEAIEFLPCMGLIKYHNTEIYIGSLQSQMDETSVINTLLPYSIVSINKKIFKQKDKITNVSIYADNIKGNIFFCIFL